MKNEWICTDPDNFQFCKKINDFRFSYIEARQLIWEQWAVCHAIIDVRDYSLDELWQYCSGYYESFEQMVEVYGFRAAIQIIAECVFEQLNTGEMDTCVKQKTMEDAEKFISGWVDKNRRR